MSFCIRYDIKINILSKTDVCFNIKVFRASFKLLKPSDFPKQVLKRSYYASKSKNSNKVFSITNSYILHQILSYFDYKLAPNTINIVVHHHQFHLCSSLCLSITFHFSRRFMQILLRALIKRTSIPRYQFLPIHFVYILYLSLLYLSLLLPLLAKSCC